MPATYVKITRAEFEDWLYALCPVFERAGQTEGVYLCPLSRDVGVKISTTLGRNDAVIQKNAGRCHMVLVRRDNGRDLHKPHNSSNSSFERCNRTQGWHETWAEALRSLFASFKGDRDHYNALAKQTHEEYAAEWRARIESIERWQTFDILADFHRYLGRPEMWLSGRQEAAVWKFLHPKRGGGPKGAKKATKKRPSSTRKTSGTVDRELLEGLEALTKAAEKADDGWTVEFATGNLRSRVQAGRAPSPRQAEILREKFTNFKIAVPSSIAA